MAEQVCLHGETNCNRCAMNDVEAPTIHLNILIDVSTSMWDRWTQTISGLNEYLDALRLDANPYKVTITKFGLESEVEDLYSEVDIDKVGKFDEKTFFPHGRGTALWGAVGISLKKVDTADPVLFIVITDGAENMSRSYTSEEIDTMIEARKKLKNYTFAYLGVDKAAWGQEIKVKAFAASNKNVTGADYNCGTYRDLATHTASYSSIMRSNAVLGHSMSVNSLFDQNAPSVTLEDEPVLTVTSGPGFVASK